MSTLERRLDLVNRSIQQSRQLLGGQSELKSTLSPLAKEIVVNPDFISEQVSKLKNTNIVSFEAFKIKRIISAENNLVLKQPDPAQEISNISDHPKRKLLDKADKISVIMRRFRRGSRCHQPGHDSANCYRGSSCKAIGAMKIDNPGKTSEKKPKRIVAGIQVRVSRRVEKSTIAKVDQSLIKEPRKAS